MLCHNPLSFQGIGGWITFVVSQPFFFMIVAVNGEPLFRGKKNACIALRGAGFL
jgi:hypothetical protein